MAVCQITSSLSTCSGLLAQVWISCFFSSCHIETVCLLTHSWRNRAEKAWNTGVSVTGSISCSAWWEPSFYVRGNGSRSRVVAMIILFWAKRENDFNIWGWLRLWVYWWRERKRRQRSDAFNAMLNGIKNICGNILTDIKWSWSVIQAKGVWEVSFVLKKF